MSRRLFPPLALVTQSRSGLTSSLALVPEDESGHSEAVLMHCTAERITDSTVPQNISDHIEYPMT